MSFLVSPAPCYVDGLLTAEVCFDKKKSQVYSSRSPKCPHAQSLAFLQC
jgi:hypothetical protein